MRNRSVWLLSFFCLLSTALLGQSTAPAASAKTSAAPAAPATQTNTSVPLANPKTPAEFFARARQLSDLEAAGIPFHLKATFVASGDKDDSGTGTYEEWWKDAGNWRKEAILGDFRLVLLYNQNEPHLYASSADIPVSLLNAMNTALISIRPDAGTEGRWRIKEKKKHGMNVTELSVKPLHRSDGSSDLAHTYYFGSDGTLQLQQSAGATTAYSDFQPLQTLLIPREIEKGTGKKQSLKMTIGTLEILNSSSPTITELSQIPSDLPLVGDYMVAVSAAISGRLVHQVPPTYPAEAKMMRIQGSVHLAVVIGENGTVHGYHLIKSPNMLLTSAALQAVRQWRYQPTIVNGRAAPVYTIITIVFRMAD